MEPTKTQQVGGEGADFVKIQKRSRRLKKEKDEKGEGSQAAKAVKKIQHRAKMEACESSSGAKRGL